MTVAQILAKSQRAMAKVSSLSFTGDATFKISSNGTSASALLLGQQPIAVHLSGKAGGVAGAAGTRRRGRRRQSRRADVTITVKTGSQAVGLGLKTAAATRGRLPGRLVRGAARQERQRGLERRRHKNAAGLGIDPAKWAASSTVTTEQLDGVSVYHVVTKADTAKITSDVLKALSSSAFSKAASSAAPPAPSSTCCSTTRRC